MPDQFQNELTRRIAMFLNGIGIPVAPGTVPSDTFLPGVLVTNGGLVVDERQLTYPGDLLHEAGHLAVVAPERRMVLHQHAGDDPAEEMMAIAWSYAAAVHMGLDLDVLFHAGGYRGWSDTLIANFTSGRPVGLPMLAWLGLAADERRAAELGVPPFPHMIRWLRGTDAEHAAMIAGGASHNGAGA